MLFLCANCPYNSCMSRVPMTTHVCYIITLSRSMSTTHLCIHGAPKCTWSMIILYRQGCMEKLRESMVGQEGAISASRCDWGFWIFTHFPNIADSSELCTHRRVHLGAMVKGRKVSPFAWRGEGGAARVGVTGVELEFLFSVSIDIETHIHMSWVCWRGNRWTQLFLFQTDEPTDIFIYLLPLQVIFFSISIAFSAFHLFILITKLMWSCFNRKTPLTTWG